MALIRILNHWPWLQYLPTYKVDIKYAKIHCCALKKEAQKPTKAGTKAENFLHSQLQSTELCCN